MNTAQTFIAQFGHAMPLHFQRPQWDEINHFIDAHGGVNVERPLDGGGHIKDVHFPDGSILRRNTSHNWSTKED